MRALLACLAAAALCSTAALAQPRGAPKPLQIPPSGAALPKPVNVNRLPSNAPATLIQHGHLYTVGPLGTLNNADVLIQAGKIVQVGTDLSAPEGAKIVNANGRPVTPGLMYFCRDLCMELVFLVV
jgi:hypothetical protein